MRLLVPLLLAIFASAEPNNEQKLKDSLATWQTHRAACGGSYGYRVETESWVGFRTRTEVDVQNNIVVRRRFFIADSEQPEFRLQWEEAGKEVGSHPDAAAAKTLDQLYVEAAQVLSGRSHPDEACYVEFDARGLLKHCYYVDTGIADDSPVYGVILASLILAE